MTMHLRLDSIQVSLPQFTLAVDATLTGRITALFGESGAGKTTLLEVIAGLRRPSRGAITFDGETLVSIAPGRPRQYIAPNHRAIGYLPQEGALFPHLSVRQNLIYGAHLHDRFAKHEKHGNAASQNLSLQHVTDVLEIGHLMDRFVDTLSGGEKQRVALGRALLSHPRLLLLDEPLAGLDTALKQRLIPYFLKIRDEFQIPTIYVTHSADEVMALCDDVLVLSRGQLTDRATPHSLFERQAEPGYTLRKRT